MKKISVYYKIIQNLTCMGFFLTLIFAVRSFQNAVPDEIYVRAGETVSYDFKVPVSIVLKQDGTEVFDYLTEDSTLTYRVNCRLFGIFPVKDITVMLVEPETVYASGMPVGIYAKTKGVLVIGNGEVEKIDGREVKPSENLVKSGDYIVSVNGKAVNEKEDLAAAVNEAGGGKDVLGIMRGEEYIEVSLDPVKSVSGKYMLGIWVRDDLAGVGNIRKFIAVLALNLENSLVTGDRRVVFFIRFDRDRRIFTGELADNIGKKLGIKSDFSTFQDRSFDLRLNSQLHIVAGQFDLIRNSID